MPLCTQVERMTDSRLPLRDSSPSALSQSHLSPLFSSSREPSQILLNSRKCCSEWNFFFSSNFCHFLLLLRPMHLDGSAAEDGDDVATNEHLRSIVFVLAGPLNELEPGCLSDLLRDVIREESRQGVRHHFIALLLVGIRSANLLLSCCFRHTPRRARRDGSQFSSP